MSNQQPIATPQKARKRSFLNQWNERNNKKQTKNKWNRDKSTKTQQNKEMNLVKDNFDKYLASLKKKKR
jgi:hypothetical protein